MPKRALRTRLISSAMIGAVLGWLSAALLFLSGIDERACVVISLSVLLTITFFSSIERRDIYSPLLLCMLLGSCIGCNLRPIVGERVMDRSILIFRGFEAGGFSAVPWSLAGAAIGMVIASLVYPLNQKD